MITVLQPNIRERLRQLFAPRARNAPNWPTVLWCRLRWHPRGVIWYTGGTSPDMHCKTCGDDLG